MKNDPASLQGAKEYAFLLLKFRQRSRKELDARLKKKKFNLGTVQQTLDFLQDKGFVDDGAFARAWMGSRLKKPLGLYKIRRELEFKGVDKEIIDTVFKEIKEDYREAEVVGKIAKVKYAKLRGADSKKIKQRIYAYLLRRGFSPDTVTDEIQKL